ncbi:MAG: fumarylacetoacetate hydrolase family protein [Planctomycetota bacterium]|nr:fumarylacetoacetate hydrolase family protein [Planctomycetota bacterium]
MLSHSKRAGIVSLVLGLNVLFLTAGMGQEKVTRYLRFRAGKTVAFGILDGDVVHQLKGNLFGKWERTEKTHPLKDVRILVPSPRPSKVIALAGNYKDHLGDKEPPMTPEPFFKLPSCLLRHGGKIIQPKDHAPVHYEAELVVVIGKRARNVAPEQALDFVLGITCGNDISARDWQTNDVQWWRAKGSDTFGPVGPYIVSGLDYNNLDMELRVNGEVRQKTNTKNQIHDLATTISFISKRITLRPGDLIFTGTPGKTQGMEIGDSVEVEIQGVGILKNKLIAEK